jgi:hypothetical protein
MWRSPGPQNAPGLRVLEHSRPRLWGCSKARGRISRSPDHPITRSPDFPITRFLRFPDHPIFRSSDQPMMPSLPLIPRSKGLTRFTPIETRVAQPPSAVGLLESQRSYFRSPDHPITRFPDHPITNFPITNFRFPITRSPITRSPDHQITRFSQCTSFLSHFDNQAK